MICKIIRSNVAIHWRLPTDWHRSLMLILLIRLIFRHKNCYVEEDVPARLWLKVDLCPIGIDATTNNHCVATASVTKLVNDLNARYRLVIFHSLKSKKMLFVCADKCSRWTYKWWKLKSGIDSWTDQEWRWCRRCTSILVSAKYPEWWNARNRFDKLS